MKSMTDEYLQKLSGDVEGEKQVEEREMCYTPRLCQISTAVTTLGPAKIYMQPV
jgi:hypothetical protein